MNPPSLLIDGFGPLPVERPGSVMELGALVRRAAAEGLAVYPFGGSTMIDYGLPPTRAGVAVDMRQLDQVIDYPARDMTITVQAGITIARLQAILAKESQRLPIDVPLDERATLGGALATNASGPRRYGFGTWRDYVIGISVVNDEGQEAKAGGRVVKNVAGYDLCKLYVGSLGTLGIITQITLKVRPLPEDQAMLVTCCDSNSLAAMLDKIHASATLPACIEVLTSTSDSNFEVMIGFEGNREVIAWQIEQLQRELGQAYPCIVRRGSDVASEFRRVGETLNPASKLSFKANVLPHDTAAFCSRASELASDISLQAHAGNGIVLGHLLGDLTLERATAMLNVLQEATNPTGNIVVTRCPSAWKTSLPVWGKPRGDAWLMRKVKEKLDPRNLFNPGRFVGW